MSFFEVECILENSYMKEELAMPEENCLSKAKILVDTDEIESLKQSLDSSGNVIKDECFISMKSGAQHCLAISYSKMRGELI